MLYHNLPAPAKVKTFLPSSTVLTHPILPICSLVLLANCFKVYSSPWLARNRCPFLLIRPTTYARNNDPSRWNSTVYVYLHFYQFGSPSKSGWIADWTYLNNCLAFGLRFYGWNLPISYLFRQRVCRWVWRVVFSGV
jgi:hypothetical protein